MPHFFILQPSAKWKLDIFTAIRANLLQSCYITPRTFNKVWSIDIVLVAKLILTYPSVFENEVFQWSDGYFDCVSKDSFLFLWAQGSVHTLYVHVFPNGSISCDYCFNYGNSPVHPQKLYFIPCVDLSWELHADPFFPNAANRHVAVTILTSMKYSSETWNSVAMLFSCVISDIFWKFDQHHFIRFSIILLRNTDRKILYPIVFPQCCSKKRKMLCPK